MTNNTQYLSNAKQKYISYDERRMIEKMNNDRIWVRAMARILVRAHSSISDELQRKHPLDVYKADYAHRDYLLKQNNKWNIKKLDVQKCQVV